MVRGCGKPAASGHFTSGQKVERLIDTHQHGCCEQDQDSRQFSRSQVIISGAVADHCGLASLVKPDKLNQVIVAVA